MLVLQGLLLAVGNHCSGQYLLTASYLPSITVSRIFGHALDSLPRDQRAARGTREDIRAFLTRFGREVLDAALQPCTLALHRLMVAEGLQFREVAQAFWRPPSNGVRTLRLRIERWFGNVFVSPSIAEEYRRRPAFWS